MKKIINYIRNPRVFFKVLLVNLAPLIKSDKLYIALKWKLTMDYPLNLNSPKTFNEKLQWLKLNDRNPLYTTMVDKYKAKQYVASIIGEEHVIPTLEVYQKVEDIDFDKLPNQFVLKCNHDSGGVVICKDKSKLDRKAALEKLRTRMNVNFFWANREWPYKNVKPCIIAEKFMTDQSQSDLGLKDYKFFCFDGKVKYLYVSEGLNNHTTAHISFLTLDWQFAPFGREDYAPFDDLPAKPTMFDELVEIAEKLSNNLHFVRVDLYQINNQIYFSEFTLHPCSGMMPFHPVEWDEKMGALLNLPKIE